MPSRAKKGMSEPVDHASAEIPSHNPEQLPAADLPQPNRAQTDPPIAESIAEQQQQPVEPQEESQDPYDVVNPPKEITPQASHPHGANPVFSFPEKAHLVQAALFEGGR